jgi:hypothetical protein
VGSQSLLHRSRELEAIQKSNSRHNNIFLEFHGDVNGNDTLSMRTQIQRKPLSPMKGGIHPAIIHGVKEMYVIHVVEAVVVVCHG